MPITPLPTPPTRSDAANFAARGDTFMAALPTFVTEANAMAAGMQTALQTSMLGVTATSNTSLTIGTGSKTLTVETGKGFVVGMYLLAASTSDPTYYIKGLVTEYVSETGSLTLAVDTTSGDGTIASWSISITALPSTTPAGIKIGGRTSNTMLAKSDQGKLINITANSFTQTFDAAATLGEGWFCYIKNSGSGDITLDPNESETIDGLTSYILYPHEVRLVACNGTGFSTVLLHGGMKIFTASGSFIRPPGVVNASIVLMSGGGGGGSGGAASLNSSGLYNSSYASSSGGGGGSGCCIMIDYVFGEAVGTSITVNVGAGGTGGAGVSATSTNATLGTTGATGGTSSFGTYSVIGGSGGVGGQVIKTVGYVMSNFICGPSGAGGRPPGASQITGLNTGTTAAYAPISFLAADYKYPAGYQSTGGYASVLTYDSVGSANGSSYYLVLTGNAGSGFSYPTAAPTGTKTAACTMGYHYPYTSVAGMSLARDGGTCPGSMSAIMADTIPTIYTYGTQNLAGAASPANATGYGSGGSGSGNSFYTNASTATTNKGGDGAPGFVVVMWGV